MSRKMNVSPIIMIKKENGEINSAIIVDNGPVLMNNNKKYTAIFNDLLDKFPDILTATFYNNERTSYRITVEGYNENTIQGVRNYFIPSYNEEDEKE